MDFTVHINVPDDRAADFADLLTGNDDDIILAAEHAMRELMDHEVDIEISFDGPEERTRRQLYAAAGN